MTEQPTVLYRNVGSLVILVHGEEPPSQAEWTTYIGVLVPLVRRGARVLVITDGVGPTAAQRELMNRYLEGPVRTAVVTAASFARGIVTVLSWFNPGIRAFAPAQLSDALDYLQVNSNEREEAVRNVAAMRMQLSGMAPVSTAGEEVAALRKAAIEPMEAVVTRLSKLREKLEKSPRT